VRGDQHITPRMTRPRQAHDHVLRATRGVPLHPGGQPELVALPDQVVTHMLLGGRPDGVWRRSHHREVLHGPGRRRTGLSAGVADGDHGWHLRLVDYDFHQMGKRHPSASEAVARAVAPAREPSAGVT